MLKHLIIHPFKVSRKALREDADMGFHDEPTDSDGDVDPPDMAEISDEEMDYLNMETPE